MMVVAVYVIWAFSCALWHFRNLKEGSHCRCRNKIKTIGEKKRKERNCIEGQYRKKKKKNKLWASRRRIRGANISKVKKSEGAGGWLGRASINLKKLPSEGWIWVSEGGWTISSRLAGVRFGSGSGVMSLNLNLHLRFGSSTWQTQTQTGGSGSKCSVQVQTMFGL